MLVYLQRDRSLVECLLAPWKQRQRRQAVFGSTKQLFELSHARVTFNAPEPMLKTSLSFSLHSFHR